MLNPTPMTVCLPLMLAMPLACAQPSTSSKETPAMTTEARPASTMPIACRPQALSKEERAQSQTLRTELASATMETKALPNGYAFRYCADAALFEKAAQWISLERRCCPFLSFELMWQEGDDAAPQLSITGPAGTKAFMAEEMPELPSH